MSYRARFRMLLTFLAIAVGVVDFYLIHMFKKRDVSVYDDFRTGFFCKFFFSLGLFLLFVFIFFKGGSLFIDQSAKGFLQFIYEFSQSSYVDSIIAFSIVFLGLGVILYFFHCQFVKLASIANEIENENIEEVESID